MALFLMWSIFFLALLDCVSRANAMLRASIVRRSRPSACKSIFSETIKWSNAKFCEKVTIITSPNHFLLFIKIFNDIPLFFFFFFFFFSFSLTFDMTPYGSENFKTLLLPQFGSFFSKLFSKSPVQSPQSLLIGIMKFQISIQKKKKKKKKIEIFANMGPKSCLKD